MNHPRVSILIPTYNYGKFLGDAIESVINQTFQDFEVIIVDNNSDDNTTEVVNHYSSDKRIRYYRNKQNIGMVSNFNKCLEYASGEYIKFLLADDKLHPQQIEKFVAVLDKYPSVSLVTSDSQSFGILSEIRKSNLQYLQNADKVVQEILNDGKGNIIGEPTTVMFRASNLTIGGFNSAYSCLIDLDYWLRQLTLGDCYFIPEVLSYFRVHDEQASSVKNYFNWFDEYHFYARAKSTNAYNADLKTLNLDKTIKKTALKSASVMYLVLSKLGNTRNRSLFIRAFKIAVREGVFFSSLFIHFKRKKKHSKMSSIAMVL